MVESGEILIAAIAADHGGYWAVDPDPYPHLGVAITRPQIVATMPEYQSSLIVTTPSTRPWDMITCHGIYESPLFPVGMMTILLSTPVDNMEQLMAFYYEQALGSITRYLVEQDRIPQSLLLFFLEPAQIKELFW